MKKSIILALVMSGVLMFSSCKKDKEPITNTATNQTVSTQQMTDEQVEAKIIDFIAKVESGDKSTEAMSVEDAVWNIEAALNYTFCMNEVDLIGDYRGNADIEFPKGNIIDFNTIISTYKKFSEKINDIKKRETYLCSIGLDVENNILRYIVGKTISDKNVKSVVGNWWYGEDHGDCFGNNAPNDGASKVTDAIRSDHMTYPSRHYWTDITIGITFIGWSYPNPDDDVAGDNYKDYLCLHQVASSGNPFVNCISQEELNFYEYNIWQIMCDLTPSGKTPKYLVPIHDFGYSTYRGWDVEFDAGIIHG